MQAEFAQSNQLDGHGNAANTTDYEQMYTLAELLLEMPFPIMVRLILAGDVSSSSMVSLTKREYLKFLLTRMRNCMSGEQHNLWISFTSVKFRRKLIYVRLSPISLSYFGVC
jgi:hypothetical protein